MISKLKLKDIKYLLSDVSTHIYMIDENGPHLHTSCMGKYIPEDLYDYYVDKLFPGDRIITEVFKFPIPNAVHLFILHPDKV